MLVRALFLDTFCMGEIHSEVGKISGWVVRPNTADKLYGATGGGVPEPHPKATGRILAPNQSIWAVFRTFCIQVTDFGLGKIKVPLPLDQPPSN